LSTKKLITRAGAAIVLAAALSGGIAAAGDPNSKEASAEMKWGFKAAKRGYWQEALLRFEHANELTPNRARILNNIAVAQEANGLYEMALLTYQEGLTLEPNNNALRRNYTRFQEFYQSYVSPPEVRPDQGADDEQKSN
jgi:tetratricopeptide (TPR) repeat protein